MMNSAGLIVCGSLVASQETRSAPPHPGNYGESAGKGGGDGSSPERRGTGDGGGCGGVLVDGGGSGGPRRRRRVLQLKGV
jgi:hypothetical protein